MKPIQINPIPEKINKTELKFYNLLDYQKKAGEIIDFRFQPIKLSLCKNIQDARNGVTYTPDFWIVHHEYFEFVDTKAKGKTKMKINKQGGLYKSTWSSMEDDARVKINLASEIYPWVKWTVYYLLPGGAWEKEDINKRS